MPNRPPRLGAATRRLAVVAATVLAAVLLGAVAVRADVLGAQGEPPPPGGDLFVYAYGYTPDGEHRPLDPTLQVGPDRLRAPQQLRVGGTVVMTLLETHLPGGGDSQACRNAGRSGEWVFQLEHWTEYPADDIATDYIYYTSYEEVGPWPLTQKIPIPRTDPQSVPLEANGIHETTPAPQPDHLFRMVYVAICL
jgi:hypothetical protein